MGYAINKHQEDGVLVISLLEDLIYVHNKDIMENVSAESWRRARENKNAYEVPTLNGNWTAFAKIILETQL